MAETAVRAYISPESMEALSKAFPELGKEEALSAAAALVADMQKKSSIVGIDALKDRLKEALGLMSFIQKETGVTKIPFLEEVASFMIKIRTLVLSDIKGLFSRQELIALIDAFNGTIVRGVSIPTKDLLIAQMEDAESLDFSSARHEYSSDALLAKLSQLTNAQAECLLLEMRVFWEEISQKENGMEEFLGEYESK